VFRADVRGQTLVMDFAANVNMNFVMRDRQTRSLWQQATGEAYEGPLSGQHLEIYPFVVTTWEEWRAEHAKTLVLAPVAGDVAYVPEGGGPPINLYKLLWDRRQQEFQDQRAARGGGRPARPLRREDSRLPMYEQVVGLDAGGARRAYPVAVLKKERVVNDQLGTQPLVLLATPDGAMVTAFARTLRGRTLTFEMRGPAGRVVDVETGSRWNAFGECVEGTLRRNQLTMLTPLPSLWFSWAQFYADTGGYTGKER
jgi:hypothetical protein